MESKKINQLATELTPALSDLTIIGDPTTGISKKITLSQMASLFTGTVEEYANLASFPLVGAADTIYIALDTNIIYRWNTSTSAYVELSPNIVTSLVFNDANGFDGTISLVGSTATLTITTALTQGSVGFIGASGALTQDNSNFFWDNTNKRLGINTNAPTTAIDAFGSGIIGRLNGTSTNNAFLGFASAGTNRWSIGNVQADHRFRIYNEATTSELVSVLSTGEFGIGIANPTTKFHIDGAASALIANLDANVSVAKSLSFRSDNSNRFNIEVSGTESGSNVGADFFIRRYSDAGALIDTPLTITRSTGAITFASALTVPNGGTGATSFSSNVILKGAGTSAITTSLLTDTGTNLTYTGEEIVINKTGGAFLSLLSADTDTQYIQFKDTGGASGSIRYNHTNNSMIFKGNGSDILTLASTGTATFSSSVSVNGASATTALNVSAAGANGINLAPDTNSPTTNSARLYFSNNSSAFAILNSSSTLAFTYGATAGSGTGTPGITMNASGNVGINESTPNTKLDIVGASNNASTYGTLTLRNPSQTGISFGALSTSYTWIQGNIFGSGTANIALNPNGSNVLIGTTTDNGSKLQVNGDGKFSSVVIANRFSSQEYSQNVSSTASAIFDSGGGSGVWLISVVVTGNPGQIGYAIVGQRFGSTLTLLSSGVGSQIAFSISGNYLQLSQTAGGSIATSISVMRINQGG